MVGPVGIRFPPIGAGALCRIEIVVDAVADTGCRSFDGVAVEVCVPGGRLAPVCDRAVFPIINSPSPRARALEAKEWRRSPDGAKTRTAEEGVFEMRTLYHPRKRSTA